MKIKFFSIFLLFLTACNLTSSNGTEQYIKVNTSTLYSLEENKNLNLAQYLEGCLSLPDQFAEVDRPSTCEVEYLDYNGNKKILKANGLLSTCIQHEMDHLEGILFIDHLSNLKKSMIIKKLSKIKNKEDRVVL